MGDSLGLVYPVGYGYGEISHSQPHMGILVVLDFSSGYGHEVSIPDGDLTIAIPNCVSCALNFYAQKFY